MSDTEITIDVEADTEDAVEAIEEITEAVDDLEAALRRLNEIGIEMTAPSDGAVQIQSNASTEL